jgi:hypothetical protein
MGSIFNELKRRKVFRVTAAYLGGAWAILEFVSVVSPMLRLDAYLTFAVEHARRVSAAVAPSSERTDFHGCRQRNGGGLTRLQCAATPLLRRPPPFRPDQYSADPSQSDSPIGSPCGISVTRDRTDAIVSRVSGFSKSSESSAAHRHALRRRICAAQGLRQWNTHGPPATPRFPAWWRNGARSAP